MTYIKTENLSFRYPGGAVFNFPDLQIRASESWLLTGNSGSGKTTLLHLLAGILSPEKGNILPKPKFGRELKKLNGQTITIRRFFLPVDITGNVFVLSYNPMNTCFFCTGDGLQTIIELNPLPAHLQRLKRLKNDNYFEVKGKLKLNADNDEHLIYILDDVEFVK